MNQEEKYLDQLADYLDGKMDEATEVAFMNELGENRELRQLFEAEIDLRALLEAQLSGIGKAETAQAFAPIIPMVVKSRKRYLGIAAVAVGLIAATALLLWNKQPTAVPPAIVVNDAPKAVPDSASLPNNIVKPVQPKIDEVFGRFYKPYVAQADPVQVSQFYTNYRSARYNAVINATAADYQLMAGSSDDAEVERFMNLYKGLSHLALGNEKSAFLFFDAVTKGSDTASYEYQSAVWYKGLTLLKLGKIDAARQSFSIVAAGRSNYAKDAKSVLSAIGQ